MKIDGSDIVPMPGSYLKAPGTVIGITRPYLKPWDIAPIRAANEPAKPPRAVEIGEVFFPPRDLAEELRTCTRYFIGENLSDHFSDAKPKGVNHGLV